MAVRAQRVAVGTSPTALTGSTSDYQSGHSGLIRNRGNATVCLGGSDVSTSTGYRLDAGEAIPLDLFDTETIYGIVASGTQTCDVLEVSV
jgi:hypothetical protein